MRSFPKQVSMKNADWEKVEKIARFLGTTRSEAIAIIIRDYWDRQKMSRIFVSEEK